MGWSSLLLLAALQFAASHVPFPATGRPYILLIVSEDNGPEVGSYGDPYAERRSTASTDASRSMRATPIRGTAASRRLVRMVQRTGPSLVSPRNCFSPAARSDCCAIQATAPRQATVLLSSNPHTTDCRHSCRMDVTIKLSRDDGRTWPVSKLRHAGPSAYSDLAVLPDGTILCFYESGPPEPMVRVGSKPRY